MTRALAFCRAFAAARGTTLVPGILTTSRTRASSMFTPAPDSSTKALLGQVLAMTDHDQHLPPFGHSRYGEAVGAGPQTGIAVRPCLCGFADSQFCLFG